MSERAEPLVTVVTPFYNTERYLAECLDSVGRQTHTRWEHILVDNGSTDGSAEVARRYAERDSRVRLLTNATHLSQVANYNHALRQMSEASAYCKLVQADDWIFPDCLRQMTTLAEAHPDVGIVSSYRLKGDTVDARGLPYTATVMPGREICRRQLLEPVFFFGSPTTVLYRAEVVRARTPFYAEGRLHEDTDACYEILASWSFGFVHQILSFSRTAPDSIMGSVRQWEPYLLDRLIALETHGPTYLTPDELVRRRSTIRRQYYRALGERFLAREGPAFWSYQRRGLASIGRGLDRRDLARGVTHALLDAALNPKQTAGRLWHGLVRRGPP